LADEIRVAVVDIYPLFRDGVVQAVRRTKGLAVVAEGASASEVEAFARTIRVDVLLIEAAVPGSLDILQRVRQIKPRQKIIFMAAGDDCEHARQALQSGAHGYVLKNVSARELVEIIKGVHAGALFVSPDLAVRLLRRPAQVQPEERPQNQVPRLTVREQQVLDQVALGLTTVEIAGRLGLSFSTIQNYKTLLFKKLGVRNRLEAIEVMFNVRNNLLRPK
jgi:two-component system, NarL family, nitrate/nitrite response regulator NarL